MDFAVLWHLGFDARKLGFLLEVANGNTAPLPGFTAFAHGGVVDVVAERQGTLKHPLLFRSGLQFVLVGLAYRLLFHTPLFCLIGAQTANMGALVAPQSRLSSHV
jgi:hypothetical protein